MLKLFITLLCSALTVTRVNAGTSDRPEFGQIERAASRICNDEVRHECWKPLEELLQRLPSPIDERQWEHYFWGRLALAQTAYLVGDTSDAARFFKLALDIAGRIDQADPGHPGIAVLLANTEAAAPALVLGDYTRALAYLDLALAQTASNDLRDELAVLRAGALAGLHRDAEARLVLDRVVAKLRLDGQAPWEAFPFAPEPVNPYQVARRAAAFYFHQGDAAAALALLERAEAARRATIEQMPKEPVPGGYWAQRLQPGILLLDMASIHEQQGGHEAAARLKRSAAAMGAGASASKSTEPPRPDPLGKVLGTLN